MIGYNKTTLGILTASTALTIQPAHALTRFFNCTTAVANKTHNLTLEDVNACYNKEFHSSGGPGIGTTPITTSESGGHRGSLHHYGTTITPIHSPSSSEGSHRASLQNEGFSSYSAAAAAASTDELSVSDSGFDTSTGSSSSSSSANGNAAASSSSSSGGASASSTATTR